ncbi:MAG: imidazole glycerol phosphate synthase subunit HisH [Syntrophomonadaceae bacterium]|jgi:glutamine amidotransferase|nr:imidazole glycerol phosphate synthase subunit HisH [Syntrophomonadaceae bacterium]
MIAIIDYGMGNLASVANAFAKLGYDTVCTNDEKTVLAADKVVLPGVGAFRDAVNNLRKTGLDEVIREVVRKRIPLLGICLGLQLLLSESEEDGLFAGLDLVAGRVVRFALPDTFKVPHMGWNQISINSGGRLLKGVPEQTHFYFVHSYYAVPSDSRCISAQSRYGYEFCCALEKGNLFATQFHPEKSGLWGLKILKNFGEMN